MLPAGCPGHTQQAWLQDQRQEPVQVCFGAPAWPCALYLVLSERRNASCAAVCFLFTFMTLSVHFDDTSIFKLAAV